MVIVSLYALQKPSIKPSASAYPRFGRPFGLTVPSTPPSPSAKTFGFGLSSLRSSEPVLRLAALLCPRLASRETALIIPTTLTLSLHILTGCNEIPWNT
jgi:hypothetical protein